MTASITLPVLVRLWTMDIPVPPLNPETFAEDPDAVQEKVDPGTEEVGMILVEVAEQTWDVVTRLVTAGLGLTVSRTLWALPGGHPHAVGVTW